MIDKNKNVQLETECDEKQPKKGLRIKLSTQITLASVIVLIMLVMAFLTDSFFTVYNIGNLFKQASVVGILAISATMVIISGGIDLSVGALVGLTAMMSAVMMSTSRLGLGILPSILVPTIVGSAIGIYHGILIYDVKLPPFITTLGSMMILQGITKVLSQAQTIAGLPDSFTSFANYKVFDFVPSMVIVWLFIAVIIHILLKHTKFGRNIYVIGSSQEVARLSGIPMRKSYYLIYVLAAFLSSIAGILLTSRLSSAVPTGGSGYEMTAIAAAVLGGASLSGAKGTIVGTVLGTILMVVITNAGVHLKIDPFIMQIVQGGLLTAAVVIDQLRQRKN